MTEALLYIYAAPMLLIWGGYTYWRSTMQRRASILRASALDSGLTQPASLHPAIDRNRCIGCRSCVSACPEQNVLGVIRDKAELIHPTHCIGHGACKTACPMNAITLVFGTAERGIDIPMITPDYETNVPGIFIAGELGGMGLIRNAIEQGRQAMDSIARYCRNVAHDRLDVVIVGAGPAGLSATLAATEKGLRFVTIEQDSLGGTVAHFPRGKVIMTAPVKLPIIGTVRFREISKESLLEFWEGVINRTGIHINFSERVETVTRESTGYHVKTSKGSYSARCILLAIGRRGTPRKLGVPGEDSPAVVYRLVDAEQYRNRKVLVVGGGDAALEAAASIAELPDTEVSLSYRSNAFTRAREKNRNRVSEMEQSGSLRVLMNSTVSEIRNGTVSIDLQGHRIDLENDAVIVCTGGILPTTFLREIGVEVETKYGTA